MAKGTVKWFSDAKGYGFITPEDGGADLFVHYTGTGDGGFRTLAEGERVELQVREGEERRLEAYDVVPISRRASAGTGTPASAKPKERRTTAGRRLIGRT